MRSIALFKPYVSWLARFYVLKVLMGTQLAEGPMVKCFEHEFGKRFNKQNVVAVNSGTSALELAYELAGIGPGDEVITPVLTCTATNLPLARRGAKIVFADIEDDLNISIKDVERKITPKTKAIVFVHFGGNSRGLGQLMVLARRHNIRVIEDAAQSIGGIGWGQGDFTCISLQAIKTLTAGDGGFLICRTETDYLKAKRLRWFGYDREKKQKEGDTDLVEAGYKYHMNDINAAIGLGNLRSLNTVLTKRRNISAWYLKYMTGRHCYGGILRYPWLTVLIHKDAQYIESYLIAHGIKISPYHYRNDKYTIFGGRNFRPYGTDLPNMNRLEYTYTLLPFHHSLSEMDVKYICYLVCQADANVVSRENKKHIWSK